MDKKRLDTRGCEKIKLSILSLEKLEVVRLTNVVKLFCPREADIERGKKLQEVSCDPILSLPQQPGSES